jgi:hypothetical protein
MASVKSLAAALAVAALVVAACAAPADDGWTPAPEQQPGQQPGVEQPAMTPADENGLDNGLDENGLDNGLDENGVNDNGLDENGENGVGTQQASPEPAVGQQTEPEPAATPGPTNDQDHGLGLTPAVAVVDHAGSLMVLQNGRCEWTDPEQPGTAVAGQPMEGATLTLTFDQTGQQPTDPMQPTEPGTDTETGASPEPGMSPEPGTETETGASPEPGMSPEPGTETGASPEPGTDTETPDLTQPTDPTTGDGSLQLTLELSRGFPAPAPDEETDEPATAPTQPTITAEHVLPFTLTEQQVQISLQLNGQDVGQPEFWTGSVAPNGLSGYIVATTGGQQQMEQTEQTEQTGQMAQLLTINFLCGQGAQETGPDMDLPTETEPTEPEPAESPAIEPSPVPSP